MEVTLKNLAQLIARCWNRAEESVRLLVAQKYTAPSEELLTDLFAGELREAVAQASRAREVEAAFLSDLRRAIPEFDHLEHNVAPRVRGLVARVNLHGHPHEGSLSAADIGIVATRPSVDLAWGQVKFQRDRATGLLAQAKLGRPANRVGRRHTWGRLTGTQERLFPNRRDYYSLLLYRINGQKANELEAFGWQICREHTVTQVKRWLRSDSFPGEISSSDVLRKLFARTIGTENPKTIQTIIDPASSSVRSIDIQIFWPDGAGPPPLIELRHQQEARAQIRQRG